MAVHEREASWPSAPFVVSGPQTYAIEQDVTQYPEATSAPTVLQTTAIELESNPSQVGSCEFTNDPLDVTAAPDDGPHDEATAEVVVEQAPSTEYRYPMTSVPYADMDPAPAASARLEIPPQAPQRRLPGPVNMVVGRDRNTPHSATSAGRTYDKGQRENLWSRWTQGWRQKFGQPSSDHKPTDAAQAGNGLSEQPETQPDRYIPAAASEPWYNRRWR